MSAFQSLPPEVLSDIFLKCLPDFDFDFKNFKLDRPPWTIARVCRKWRYVCLSTPLLWVHIPTISLDHEYKPGFFELLEIVMKLSFPLNVHLRMRDTNPEKIQYFENVLPRIDQLDFRANLSMIEAFVERKQSFNRLKSASISFDVGSPSQALPRLDFLAEVNSLFLHYDPSDPTGDTTPYALLRSVDLHWPNLTEFTGLHLPIIYLRKFLFSAPLLQHITMIGTSAPVDSVTADPADPAPTSILRHTNLTALIIDGFPSYHHQLNCLYLPRLRYLHLGSCESGYAEVLSFFEQTQGSLLILSLMRPLRLSEHQRTLYSLCPHLDELTLTYAGAEDLKNLTITTGFRPCPALRHLVIRSLTLDDDISAQILQEFLCSRGSAPFNAPGFPPGCSQLDSISVRTSNSNTISIFRRICLKIDDNARETIEGIKNNVGLWDFYSYTVILKRILSDFFGSTTL